MRLSSTNMQARKMLFAAILSICASSSKKISIYNDEMIVARCFIGFIIFSRKSLGNTFKVILDERIQAILEELQQFLNPNEVVLLDPMNNNDYLGSACVSCLGFGISSLLGGFNSKELFCGPGSSLSTSSGSRKGDRGDPHFRSLLYGGRFLSYQECVCWGGQGRRIGSRCDAYASSLLIGFPSFGVSGEGDKGEGVRIPGEPIGEEWE